MTRTTVIHTHGGGRFGNQLLLFGHLIALAASEGDLEIVHMPFWPYASLCAGTDTNPLCIYPARRTIAQALPGVVRTIAGVLPRRVERSLAYRVPRLLHRLNPQRSIDLDYAPQTTDISAPAFLARLRSAPWMLLAGYDLRAWTAFDAESDRLRAFLRPLPRFWDAAARFVAPLRQRHDPLIGVHIRRTDYRVWRHGKFFFDDSQYVDWIEQMRSRWGARTGFVLSADEIVDRTHFNPEYCHWSDGTVGGPGHFLDGLAALGSCDVVAAVPSTFAAWASFFGEKPILLLATGVNAATRPCLERVWTDGRRDPLMVHATDSFA
ncbi:MAG TPA: hypothetical protein VFA59_00890 [Vicinamibacterales bacterium]|nr:hypothetical protein [Vicinamibacterales bacterium]